jgi:hypothetical protein
MAAAIAQGHHFLGVIPKKKPDFFPLRHGRPQVSEKGPGTRPVMRVKMIQLDFLTKENGK